MYTIQQYSNHAYRQVAKVRSKGAAGLAAQRLSALGKFRVLSSKGRVVFKGRVVKRGEVVFD